MGWSGKVAEPGVVHRLELLAANDPFHKRAEWDNMRDRYGERVTSVVIENASHALFPSSHRRLPTASSTT